MSTININNLTFCYDGSYDNIFENVSLSLNTSWKLGFVGRNGRGKTTLLRLLLGELNHNGSISADMDFDYFPFTIKDKSQSTLDVLNSLNTDYEFWKLCRELSLLSVSEDVLYQPFNTLSSGEQTKVMLAILFLKENNFLLIDEPTNHLDMAGRELVSEYLNSKQGFILVSHDKAFLDNCIDHVLSINKTDILVTKGDYTTWQYNKEIKDNYEIGENEKLKKNIKRMEIDATRTAKWSDKIEATKLGDSRVDTGHIGRMAAKMMKRSMATQTRKLRAIEEKQRLLKNIETAEPLKITPLKYHSKQLVFLKELSISYDDKTIFSDVGLTLNQGDRLAIIGKNGCGKTSLVKLIMGEDIAYSGIKEVGSNLIISYVSQDTSHLKGNLKDYAFKMNIDESLFKAILRKLDFQRIQFEKNMEDFSEGQKKKVLLAMSLSQNAHLYIWDEPLNYIDILSRTQIEALILKYQPTMLFIEHDSYFVDIVGTTQIKL